MKHERKYLSSYWLELTWNTGYNSIKCLLVRSINEVICIVDYGIDWFIACLKFIINKDSKILFIKEVTQLVPKILLDSFVNARNKI